MKRFSGFLFLLAFLGGSSQKNIDALIKAEKDFAAYSVANGMKDAFLKYLDTSSVIFEKGKPVKGLETWNKREKVTGILNWYPVYGEIASSRDLGFTSGPWTFQPKTIKDSIVSRGCFNSVWHLDMNGKWKNIVDLGVNKTPADSGRILKKNVLKHGNSGTENELLLAEETFEKEVATNIKFAYKNYLSRRSILCRNGVLPAYDLNEQISIIEATPAGIEFINNGYGISGSGDLGYVYGTGTLNGKNFNFLRVWRKENTGWKLALEALPY
jgi:hypothetical protein